MKLTRRGILAAAMMGACAATASGQAIAFPEEGRSVTMILGSGAGGSADLLYRLVADGLEKETGSNIEVINRDGAGTQLSLQAIATAEPDGYTIGQAALPNVIAFYLNPTRDAQFDENSFIPVAMLTFDPGATAVRADSPYQTMQDLIDAAKENPGTIKFGSASRGSRQHLDALQLEQMADVDFLNIHADSSQNPVALLLGGHLDAVHESVGDFANLVESGQLRVLGVWDEERSPILPDVPTMKEHGMNLESGVSRGIIVPAGTPEEAVSYWDSAIKNVTESQEYREGMEKLAQPERYLNRAEYTEYWENMEENIRPLIELAN